MQREISHGFSLLELMIAITILGILASLAIPSYQDYAVRAKVGEALNIFAASKLSVSEYYVNYGVLPNTMDEAGITDFATQYVSAVDYTNTDEAGEITLTLSEAVGTSAAGKKISLQGTIENNYLHWRCRSANDDGLEARYLPASCRGRE